MEAPKRESLDAFGTFLESMRDVKDENEPPASPLPARILDALDTKTSPIQITDVIEELGEPVLSVASAIADLQKDGFADLDINGVEDTVEITETGRRAVRLARNAK